MSSMHAYTVDTAGILPEYVNDMPFLAKIEWLKAFNMASDLYGSKMAIKIANKVALRILDKLATEDTDNEEVEIIETLAESDESTDLVHMQLKSKNDEMIAYSQNGEIVIEAVLADDQLSTDGKKFSHEALISMAEKINKDGMAMPDIEHQDYNKILEESKGIDDFKSKLRESKGLLTKVKAYFNSGKLFIKAWLDKRYKKHADLYKSLSIEANATYDPKQPEIYVDADPLSFTFTNNPKIKSANILNIE